MKKKHRKIDYFIVCGMVCGLVVFMQADARVSHQFSWVGVAMLTTSLSIDGVIVNFNEVIMNRHGLDQVSACLDSIANASTNTNALEPSQFINFSPFHTSRTTSFSRCTR